MCAVCGPVLAFCSQNKKKNKNRSSQHSNKSSEVALHVAVLVWLHKELVSVGGKQGTGNNICERQTTKPHLEWSVECVHRKAYVRFFVQGFVLLQGGKIIFVGGHSH